MVWAMAPVCLEESARELVKALALVQVPELARVSALVLVPAALE